VTQTTWWDDPDWRASTKILDDDSIKGLAHPLRLRLLRLLREEGPSTATRLADRLGGNSGTTSYHLRQLAQYGFVAEDAGHGDSRERWWRALHRASSWTSSTATPGASLPAAESVLLEQQLGYEVEAVRRWLAVRDTWPAVWRAADESSDFTTRMTAVQTKALGEELRAVLVRHAEAAETSAARADADEGEGEQAVPVLVVLRALPRLPDQEG